MNSPARCLLSAALAASLAAPVAAQPQLYGPQPPAGSAFIRFVNATGAEISVRPDFLPAQNLGITPAARIGVYRTVERVADRTMSLEVREGERRASTTLRTAPGNFVTILIQPAPGGGITAQAVQDGGDGNQARARLAFYNTLPDCPAAALSIDPDGPTVFADVAPGASKSRSVNPASARLLASCGDRGAPAFPLEGLEAGSRYSIWLMPGTTTPAAFMTRDGVPGAWQPGG
jgi:hypothetical protein